jgi:uncharacterized protein YggT (Ycf19 family)
MRAILDVILLVLQIYIWLLIAAAVLSWLIAFNVVNTRNQVVAMVGDFLYRITEPVLRPIRSILPPVLLPAIAPGHFARPRRAGWSRLVPGWPSRYGSARC